MRIDKKSEFQVLPVDTLVYGKNTDNGWYLVLRARWINSIQAVIDPWFFRAHVTKCYKAVKFSVRKHCDDTNYRFTKVSAWVPMDNWISLKDRYFTWSRVR